MHHFISKIVLFSYFFVVSLYYYGKTTNFSAQSHQCRPARTASLQGHNLQRRLHNHGVCRTHITFHILENPVGGGGSHARRSRTGQRRSGRVQLRHSHLARAQSHHAGTRAELPVATGMQARIGCPNASATPSFHTWFAKGPLLPSKRTRFACQKDSFYTPKGFVLQCKRTTFENHCF